MSEPGTWRDDVIEMLTYARRIGNVHLARAMEQELKLLELQPEPSGPTPRERVEEIVVLAEQMNTSLIAMLTGIRRIRELLDELEYGAIVDAKVFEWSWADIGGLLGVSRQAVQQRVARAERADREAGLR